MGAKRKFEVEITENRKGDGFKDSERDATRWGKKLGDEGEKAGNKLAEGVKAGTDKVGSSLESAGSAAGDLFSSGFDIGSISDTLASGLGSMGGKLGTAAAGLGVAAAGAFAAGYMNELNNEVTTDRLAAKVGGGDWGKQAGEIAGDLYLDGFGESMDDVAEVTSSVLQSSLVPFGANQAALEDLVGTAMTFSDVMGQDVNASITAVDRMIASGLVPNAEAGFDILTTGLQELGPAGEDLLDTFTEYPMLFKSLGFDGAQALGAINTLMNAGVRNTDLAADALKEFGIRAQDGSDLTAQSFKDLGFNADAMSAKIAGGGPKALEGLNQILQGLSDIEDPVKRNNTGVALFGTQWEDMAGAIAGVDFAHASDGLGNIAGSTDELNSAYDNAASHFETFRRQALEKLTVFVSDSVLPKLESLKAWAEENPGAFQIIAGVIGGVLVVAFAAWAVSAASAAIATIAATWPILLIGAAVIALAALVVIHFGTIKRWVSNVFNWVKDNWPLLLGILTGPFGWAAIAISRNWSTIKAGATAVKDWVVGKFNAVVDFFKGLPGRISSAVSGMWDGISSGFKSVINKVINWWNNLRFPSFTIPSMDPLGRFGPSIGGGTIGGWNLPNIPTLAAGGVVHARPGGTLALLGEGGRDEMVTPLDGRHGAGASVYFDFRGASIHDRSTFERDVVSALESAGGKGIPITIAGRRL